MADELFDTDILIDHLHGLAASTDYLKTKLHAAVRVHVSVITISEIFAGLRAADKDRIEQLIALFSKREVSEDIARIAGGYLNEFSKSHHIDLGDALIASTAKVLGATLVTRNVKHYPMKDITVIVPYAGTPRKA
jgi:predicted nucleic acid-binding protein